MIRQKKNIVLSIILILILIIGSFFRFYGLEKKGFFLPDSAYHFGEAKTIASIAKWVILKFLGTSISDLKEYLRMYAGTIPSLPKEGFLTFASLSILIFGPYDYATLIVSALFGSLTVFIIYLTGKQLFSDSVGVLAALILAVSRYHICYSRTGLASITATFFLFLGFYLYILYFQNKDSSNKRYLACAGLSIGYAFTCHYNLFWVVVLFLIFEAVNINITWNQKIARYGLFLFFALIPVLFFQMSTVLIKYFVIKKSQNLILNSYFLENKNALIGTYFQQLKNIFKLNLSYVKEVDPGLLFYPLCILHYEGLITALLLLSGVVVLSVRIFKKFSYPDFLLLVFFAIPTIGYSFSHVKVARTIVVISPLIALIAARTVVILMQNLKGAYRIILLTVFIFMIVSIGIFNSKNELSYKSGYKEAMRFIARSGKTDYLYLTIDSNLSLTEAYVDKYKFRDHKRFRVDSLNQAKELYHKYDVRYLIVDQFQYFFPEELQKSIASLKPAFETFHSTDAYIYDGYYDVKGVVKKIKEGPQKLVVYDLKGLFS